MITRQMETAYDENIVVSHKMCEVFGIDSKMLPVSNARRNLFGGNEDATIRELLTEQTNEMAERAAREWNFDFTNEKPIPGGRFLWESVRSSEVPTFYSTGVNDNVNKEKFEEDGIGKENTVLMDVCVDNKDEKVTGLKCNKVKLVQTSIKGYGRVQKRRTSKRLIQKRFDSPTLTGSSRVADYILRGSSKGA